ncbi:peptidase M28 [Zobellia sp. OII3]|uniref:M20/M25/M40 family metallo-hydrolase n=1 Tax=Zobellia sp. OII3 TaxID=2034520 RepID=UPI000B52A972|nr:M20/M25/M40 family metallo-hydrolase [Zobellia sp. OII3]OWW27063.1 peptidase M28 [Zobellia sp. OII3]
MRKFPATLSFLLLVAAIYWGFHTSMPVYQEDSSTAASAFSTDRALKHVKKLSQEPHAVGFPGHKKVQDYIVSELEKMGLQTSLQTDYAVGDWGNMGKPENIIARIKGTENGKALLLLSHYDSHPHSALGASDAGSGVATILEGLRAFLSEKQKPKNDIIILFTDGEELGLNGADLFVNRHEWAKDVGLVLNFEARGSGGPSYTFIETNRGNQHLIREFIKANPKYPMANSLYYSIYKMLPNDTDLTVFREDRDIQGFNFAFIDDHFDYHTAQDAYERLDKKTLAHQGSYLAPLLEHFSQTDLSQLQSPNDYVYFNMPLFGVVSYPFDWIWPMFLLAILSFIGLLIYGFRKGALTLKGVFAGFVPLLLSVITNGLVGYFSWPALKWAYPEYKDMLHGFTYNGYAYIFAFACLAIAICFGIYHKFKKLTTADLLVAPLVLWLIICGLMAQYLPGASFFTIPVFALLAAGYVGINQKAPDVLPLLFLSLPALWLYTPLVKGFPVGLGLKMLVGCTLLVTLTFFLLLPLFARYRHKKKWAYLALLVFIGAMAYAHIHSGFNTENGKPSSLVYILDTDSQTAQWASYDQVPITWNQTFLGEGNNSIEKLNQHTIGSKYNTVFTRSTNAPLKTIEGPNIETLKDTLIGNDRKLILCVTPQRHVNRLDVFTKTTNLKKVKVNQLELSPFYLNQRKSTKLVTHYITDDAYTELEITIPKDSVLELTFYEASNDLLTHPLFEVPERPENSIPMPFVLNDAIITTKTIKFE